MQTSTITKKLKQSGIRAASTRCAAIDGINLGQGICDLPIHDVIKKSATAAIENNYNIYSPCEGVLSLRESIAKKINDFNHVKVDPTSEVVVTHGSTGAFVCAVTSLFNPGDEVILFEPFYSYHKNILDLQRINTVSVPIPLDTLLVDMDRLKQAITPKTKGIVICTPCNPSGKVFSREELLMIGKLASAHNLCVITDEIYEYITYPGYTHVSMASLENFKEFTLTISGFSKTYNMTGWRLGYISGPREAVAKIALTQDLLYVCPNTPLQYAVIDALALDEAYYTTMKQIFLDKRDVVVGALENLGFRVTIPQGAYYLLADCSQLGLPDSEAAALFLLENAKVSTVPGTGFYQNPNDGKQLLRFCYALEDEKIEKGLMWLKQALQGKSYA